MVSKFNFGQGERDKNCFCLALISYLKEVGDTYLPIRVAYNYPRHSLVNEDGSIPSAVVTRVTLDLTQGRYEVSEQGDFSKTRESTRYWHPDKFEGLLRVFDEEIASGRINHVEGNLVYEPPAIITLGNKKKNGYRHVVVDCGDDWYIDRSKKLKIFRKEVESHRIKSVLTLKRK